MFVAKVGSPEERPLRKDNDPEPSPEQQDGDYRRGAKRLARQLKLAQELLSKELGDGWRERLSKLDRQDRLRLAKKLLEAGISAVAISSILRLRGSDLRLVKLGLVGVDGDRSEEAVNEGVEPKKMGRDEERKLTKEQVIEQVLAEADMRGAERAAQTDRDYQMKLRMKAMQSTKPVEAREIMDMTFHHNLEQALGRYVAHLLSSHGLVKLDERTVLDSDWRRAFMAYSQVVDNLIQLHEDAKLLERIKRERDLYEAYLSYIVDVFEKKAGSAILQYYNAYILLTDKLPRILCNSCKNRLMDMLIAEAINSGQGYE
jgi:hypothetical protein